jgi:hypothetical protein
MTRPSKSTELTQEEWNDMKAIRNAIKERPHSVHPDKMEAFTEYLIRSMRGMDC